MASNINPLFPDFGRVLGKSLPTPIFKSIEIATLTADDPDYDAPGDMLVRANISISLTKPDNENMDATALLEHYFNDLYLYVYTSPFVGINQRLRDKVLNLRDLFDAYSANHYAMTAHNFVGPGYEGSGSGTGWDFPSSIYESVIEFQKSIFLQKTLDNYFLPMEKDTDAEGTILGYTPERAAQLLESPLEEMDPAIGTNAIYHLFWGKKGPSGRWVGDGDAVHMEYGTHPEGGLYNWLLLQGRGYPADGNSFMRYSIESTLKFLISGGYGTEAADNVTWRRKIPLSDFASPDNDWYAQISENQEYDKEGNSIFKIHNIEVGTRLNLAERSDQTALTSYTKRLDSISDVFSIAFVGLDIDNLGGARNDGADPDSRSTSYGWGVPHLTEDGMEFGGHAGVFDLMPRRSIFNAYFGNIVYEHILENGSVPIKPTESFYKVSDETQYDGIAIQAWNTKYYAPEPIGRAQIQDEIKKLIEAYKAHRPNDEQLDLNLKNLEYILEVHRISPNIFMEFGDYMKTYNPKSPITQSGKFYSSFKKVILDFNKKIMSQERLTKKLSKSSIVYDGRRHRSAGGVIDFTYVAPYVYTGYSGFIAGTEDEPYSTYIPTKWINYVSNVHFKKSDTGTGYTADDSEWWMMYETIISLMKYGTATGDEGGSKTISDYFGSTSDIAVMESWHAAYVAGEIDDADATIATAASQQTDLYFRNNSEYELLGYHDDEDSSGTYDYGGGGYSTSPDHRGNRIVVNTGWYFFDWEKAFGTYSALAQFVSPAAIERFLGYRLPYQLFPVLTTSLARRGANLSELPATFQIECRMKSQYNDVEALGSGLYPTYPKSSYSIAAVHTSGDPDSVRKFGIPNAYVQGTSMLGGEADDTEQLLSYIKFVNFDVANGDIYTGLKTLRNYAPWSPEIPFMPVSLGSRVCGDYRLMAFKFQDIMDDDVAYYNAIAGNIPASEQSEKEEFMIDSLKTMHSSGEPFGQYRFYVCCEDRSLSALKFLWIDVLKPVKERFEIYLERAEELCSFNNIENRFNTFFANGIEEHYNLGTAPTMTTPAGAPPAQPPWFEAPYIIAAFMFVLQRQYKSSDLSDFNLEQAIMDTAISLARQCNPRTGSLFGVRSILESLESIEDKLKLRDEATLNKIREITGDETIEELDDLTDANYAVTPIVNAAGSSGFDFFAWSGGTLPGKCAFFVGSVDQDQPIFGDVMLDGTGMTYDIEGLEALEPVEPPPDYDVSEDHVGPGTDADWLYRADEILSATQERLQDIWNVSSAVDHALVDKQAIIMGLAAIEIDTRLDVGSYHVFDVITNPEDWIVDGTVIWQEIASYLATNSAGTAMNQLLFQQLMGTGAFSPDLANQSIAAIRQYMLNPAGLSSAVLGGGGNFFNQLSRGNDLGSPPSMLAPGGFLSAIAAAATFDSSVSVEVREQLKADYFNPGAGFTVDASYLSSRISLNHGAAAVPSFITRFTEVAVTSLWVMG